MPDYLHNDRVRIPADADQDSGVIAITIPA
jgi:hypothetical protein